MRCSRRALPSASNSPRTSQRQTNSFIKSSYIVLLQESVNRFFEHVVKHTNLIKTHQDKSRVEITFFHHNQIMTNRNPTQKLINVLNNFHNNTSINSTYILSHN